MKGRRRDRDTYADAGRAMRWAFRLYADAKVRWRRSDAEVLHTVIGCTAGYSKVWDWVTLRVIAELSDLDRRTCQLSLHRLDEHNVISWEPGDGREWSRVALPTEGGRLAWTSEGRSHTTAPGPPSNTSGSRDASSATAPHAPRGGDLRPPQGRLHSTAPLREGLSRSERSFEKEVAIPGNCSPSVKDASTTETPFDPGVDLLRNVNPKPKPRGRQTMWWTDLHGNPTDAYGRTLDENPAPMDDGASA